MTPMLHSFRQILVAFVAAFALVVSACGGSAELTAAHHTLDITAMAVNTSWAFALDVREHEQREVLARARAEEVSVDEAERLIGQIRAEWEPRLAAFQAVRNAHEVALQVYDTVKNGREPMGLLVSALADILELYRNLKALLPAHITDRMP